MRPPISDEFTNLPVSRQRKWAMRKHAKQLCVICGQPAVTEFHCLDHAVGHRERRHQAIGAKARLNSLTYRLEAMAR